MDVLIDSQRVVTVTPYLCGNEDGDTCTILTFSDTHEVLRAWVDLDTASRNYRWGNNENDNAPSILIIAWADKRGNLTLSDVDPFWDGLGEHNGYELDYLAGALPGSLAYDPIVTAAANERETVEGCPLCWDMDSAVCNNCGRGIITDSDGLNQNGDTK